MLRTTNRISRPRDFSQINGRFDKYTGDIIEPEYVQTDNPDTPDANEYRSLTYTINGGGAPGGSTATQQILLGRRFQITNMRFNGVRNPADASTYFVSFDGETIGTGSGLSPTIGGLGTLTDVTGIFLNKILSDDAVILVSVTWQNLAVGYLEFRIQGFFLD